MQTVKSIISLAQTERELDLDDRQIATYVKLGYLTPLVRIDQRGDGFICEPFFRYRRKDPDYFHFDVVTYGEEICFDCQEMQRLRDRLLDLAKQVDTCANVKPDPSFVPAWERPGSGEPSTMLRACRLPAPPPALNGGHSEALAAAQDQGERIAELERQLAEGDSIRGQVEHGTRSEELERQLAGAQGEIARLKEQLAGHSAQAQSVASSQTEALELEKAAQARTREDLAAAQARITELDRQLAGTQEELDATKAKLKEALEGHGVCSYVIRERQAGTREEDIAAGLLKRGLNGSQAGAWIYSREWGSEAARKKSFQRLTGTA